MNTDHAKDKPFSTTRALSIERAGRLLKSVIIPPCPAVLFEVLKEQAKPAADLDRIAEVISDDVALSAAVLKVVNAPFFGLRRPVGSIPHAVRMLGVSNIINIVTGLLLRSSFGNQQGAFMDSFWRQSNQLAMVAALVARLLQGVASDVAYALGLFCDCGVPLLLQRFPNYPEVYDEALRADACTASAFETVKLGTDHTVVGYLMGRTWKLPDILCRCLLHHHDAEDYYLAESAPLGDATVLLAVLMLAQSISRELAGLGESHEWTQVGPSVLSYLGLVRSEVDGVRQEAAELSG